MAQQATPNGLTLVIRSDVAAALLGVLVVAVLRWAGV